MNLFTSPENSYQKGLKKLRKVKAVSSVKRICACLLLHTELLDINILLCKYHIYLKKETCYILLL